MRLLGTVVTLVVLVVVVSGCLGGSLLATGTPSSSQTFTEGVNDFGLRLVKALWEQEGGNVFLSPTSIALCLSMVAHGARGETQREMYEALGLAALAPEEVKRQSARLVETLNTASSDVTLYTANALWAREGIPFYQTYLEDLKTYYRAEAETIDFTDPATIPRINQWVREKTRGTIPTILDRLPENAILVLLNATYFKGKWETAFDPAHTQDLPFFPENGTPKDLPTMWQEGSFLYLETEDFQAVKLPYADDRFSMYLFLPRREDGLGAFLGKLSESALKDWIAAMEKRQGEISLPRFQVTFEQVLNDILIALGMENVFNPSRADLSGMLPVSPSANAYLSEVKHKSFLEVNEEGTEASAVTSGIIAITAVPLPGERFIMRVDHPFFLIIRDERDGSVLFAGAIENPESQ